MAATALVEEISRGTVLTVGGGRDSWTAVADWIGTAGFAIEVLALAHEVVARLDRVDSAVVLLDAAVPGYDEIIETMSSVPGAPPLIVLTERVEFDAAVRAFRSGAVDVLQLPIARQRLIERLAEAAQDDIPRAQYRRLHRRLTRLIGSLTPRERQVMECVVVGSANKQIAADLGISEKTVEVHRHKVMRKMEADSLAALVRMNMVIEASAGGRAALSI